MNSNARAAIISHLKSHKKRNKIFGNEFQWSKQSQELTLAQTKVLKAIWKFGTLKAAGDMLNLNVKTIEYHTYAMRYRVGLINGSIIDLLRWGVKNKILD